MSNDPEQTPPRRQTAQGALRDPSFGSFSAILTDIVVWLLATDLAALARFDFQVVNVRWEAVSVLGLLLAGGQLVLGALVLLSRGRYQSGSFDEMRAIAVSVSAVSVIATAIVLAVRPDGIPRSVPFVVWPLALVGNALRGATPHRTQLWWCG